jgi:hypothetical protein
LAVNGGARAAADERLRLFILLPDPRAALRSASSLLRSPRLFVANGGRVRALDGVHARSRGRRE